MRSICRGDVGLVRSICRGDVGLVRSICRGDVGLVRFFIRGLPCWRFSEPYVSGINPKVARLGPRTCATGCRFSVPYLPRL
jgi:hypothetical protein